MDRAERVQTRHPPRVPWLWPHPACRDPCGQPVVLEGQPPASLRATRVGGPFWETLGGGFSQCTAGQNSRATATAEPTVESI